MGLVLHPPQTHAPHLPHPNPRHHPPRPIPKLAAHLERRVQRPQRLPTRPRKVEHRHRRQGLRQQRTRNLHRPPRQHPAAERQPRHHRPQRRPHRPRRTSRATTPPPASTPKITSRKNTDASKPASSSPPAKASGPPSGSSATTTKPAHWPDCGEIDILETIGAPDTIYSTIHGPGYSGRKGISHKIPPSPRRIRQQRLPSLRRRVVPRRHQVLLRRPPHRPAAPPPTSRPTPAGSTTTPSTSCLNLAVGGYWPGNPDDTTVFPQQMLVDYVRVYSRKSESRSQCHTRASSDRGQTDDHHRHGAALGRPRPLSPRPSRASSTAPAPPSASAAQVDVLLTNDPTLRRPQQDLPRQKQTHRRPQLPRALRLRRQTRRRPRHLARNRRPPGQHLQPLPR